MERDLVVQQRPRPAPSEGLFIRHGGRTTPLTAGDLFAERASGFSQQVIQVSPDGRRLAWVEQVGVNARLWVRDARAQQLVAEGALSDFRFAPDSREVAVLVDGTVRRVDLDTGATTASETLDSPRWLEHTAEGLVVLHRLRGEDAITLVPRWGRPRTLATGPISRITAAGSRLAWFEEPGDPQRGGGTGRLLAMQLPDGEPTVLGRTVGGRVQNAEMAPDGSALAWVTGWGVFRATGAGEPEHLEADDAVHSLWYGPDGELAWASPAKVVVEHGGERAEKALGARTMRLRRDGAGLVVVRDADAVVWDWRHRAVSSLVPPQETALRAVDSFEGGVVVWAAHPAHAPARADRKRR